MYTCKSHFATPMASQSGVVLITTLVLMLLLLFIGVSGLALSRTDILIARNLLSGVQTLWVARAGTEVGSNWLVSRVSPVGLAGAVGPVAPVATGGLTGPSPVM